MNNLISKTFMVPEEMWAKVEKLIGQKYATDSEAIRAGLALLIEKNGDDK